LFQQRRTSRRRHRRPHQKHERRSPRQRSLAERRHRLPPRLRRHQLPQRLRTLKSPHVNSTIDPRGPPPGVFYKKTSASPPLRVSPNRSPPAALSFPTIIKILHKEALFRNSPFRTG